MLGGWVIADMWVQQIPDWAVAVHYRLKSLLCGQTFDIDQVPSLYKRGHICIPNPVNKLQLHLSAPVLLLADTRSSISASCIRSSCSPYNRTHDLHQFSTAAGCFLMIRLQNSWASCVLVVNRHLQNAPLSSILRSGSICNTGAEHTGCILQLKALGQDGR
jgi:hypothetical protein